MTEILEECKQILKNHYADRFVGLVLYGSTARNEDDLDSDIDILVLLKKPFDYFQELWSITDLLYTVQLKSDRLISAKPADIEEFENGRIQLYRNARREGISL